VFVASDAKKLILFVFLPGLKGEPGASGPSGRIGDPGRDGSPGGWTLLSFQLKSKEG